MSYTRVLHPKVLHQRTRTRTPSHSSHTSHSVTNDVTGVLRHTAAVTRAHNVLQGTVEQLR
jgi:hypothetical protein